MNHLPKWYSWLILLILGIAVSLRLVVYFQNRALFIDEANVCMDIISKDYFELFQVYESGQQIPPFVAIFIKFFGMFKNVVDTSNGKSKCFFTLN
jgi:hypothetical protein